MEPSSSTRYAFYPTRKIARCYNYFWDRLKADIEQVESPLEFLLKMYQKHMGEEVTTRASAYATVSEAILQAKHDALAQDVIFIGGSNYVVGEALHCLR